MNLTTCSWKLPLHNGGDHMHDCMQHLGCLGDQYSVTMANHTTDVWKDNHMSNHLTNSVPYLIITDTHSMMAVVRECIVMT